MSSGQDFSPSNSYTMQYTLDAFGGDPTLYTQSTQASNAHTTTAATWAGSNTTPSYQSSYGAIHPANNTSLWSSGFSTINTDDQYARSISGQHGFELPDPSAQDSELEYRNEQFDHLTEEAAFNAFVDSEQCGPLAGAVGDASSNSFEASSNETPVNVHGAHGEPSYNEATMTRATLTQITEAQNRAPYALPSSLNENVHDNNITRAATLDAAPGAEMSSTTGPPSSPAQATGIQSQAVTPSSLSNNPPAPSSPQYVADIPSPARARELLAQPDPAECHKLSIPRDDWQTVKMQQHPYARLFYDALLVPGINSPPRDPDAEPKENDEVLKARFTKRQTEAVEKLKSLLDSPAKLRKARANCILAFDAAIFMHEHGVADEIWTKFESGRAKKSGGRKKSAGAKTSVRAYHIDVETKCSDRLLDMVEAVKDYKLIALDVVKGTDLQRLAHDATAYRQLKITYLKSNVTRQANTDDKKAKANTAAQATLVDGGSEDEAETEVPPKKATMSLKRGRKAKVDADTDLEDDKPAKKKRALKKKAMVEDD